MNVNAREAAKTDHETCTTLALETLRAACAVDGATVSLLAELTGMPNQRITNLTCDTQRAKPKRLPRRDLERIMATISASQVRAAVERRRDAARKLERILELPSEVRDRLMRLTGLTGNDITSVLDLRYHAAEPTIATIDLLTEPLIADVRDAALTALWVRCLRAQGHDCARQADAYGRTEEWVEQVCDGALDQICSTDVHAVLEYVADVERSAWYYQNAWGGNQADAEYAKRRGWYPLACYDLDDGVFCGAPRTNYIKTMAAPTPEFVTAEACARRMIEILRLSLQGKAAIEVAGVLDIPDRMVARYTKKAGLQLKVVGFHTRSDGVRETLVEPADAERAAMIRKALAEYRATPLHEQDPVAALAALDIAARADESLPAAA